jgi:protein-L-isoaspartate(D-aspartate) O-methyltransferase
LVAGLLACSRTTPAGAPPPEGDAVASQQPLGSEPDPRSNEAPAVPASGARPSPDGEAAARRAELSALAELPPPAARDPVEAREARERLVRQIEVFDRPWGGSEGWDKRALDAMRRVPRHLFVPGASLHDAYRDAPYPIGHGQTISQPTVVALMTHALKLTGSERVLEVGTGSGYQAAVLGLLAREVASIEIVAPLGDQARRRLAALGYHNVEVRIGDGYRGWPEKAPFDRIILTAAPPEMPAGLVEQLREGGIIVAPVGEIDQDLVRWTKRAGSLHKENLGAVRFVPMVRGDR